MVGNVDANAVGVDKPVLPSATLVVDGVSDIVVEGVSDVVVDDVVTDSVLVCTVFFVVNETIINTITTINTTIMIATMYFLINPS